MTTYNGIVLIHNIGANQELYKKHGVEGSVHIQETEQLCEVIRRLESTGLTNDAEGDIILETRLMTTEKTIRKALQYLLQWIGTPYRYGPSDCSWLAHEFLQMTGVEPRGFDCTADELYRKFKNNSTHLQRQGHLIFFLKGPDAVHVSIALDESFIIHAQGGSRSTLTEKDAIAKNAYVRVDHMPEYADNRGQGFVLCDPFQEA